MITTYIGVDNGLDGGAVAIREHDLVGTHGFVKIKTRWGNQVSAPQFHAFIKSIAESSERVFVLIEEPAKGFSGKTNATSIQSTGVSFGKLHAVVEMLADESDSPVSFASITPQQWQKMFFTSAGDSKLKSATIATSLFPKAELRVSDAGKKPHDGFTDAILIAEFARRTLL